MVPTGTGSRRTDADIGTVKLCRGVDLDNIVLASPPTSAPLACARCHISHSATATTLVEGSGAIQQKFTAEVDRSHRISGRTAVERPSAATLVAAILPHGCGNKLSSAPAASWCLAGSPLPAGPECPADRLNVDLLTRPHDRVTAIVTLTGAERREIASYR